MGDNIRRFRQEAAFTQERLAEKANLSIVFISLLENGWRTASFDSLLQIARALGVTIEDLVRGIK